jgi:hypothetical protein
MMSHSIKISLTVFLLLFFKQAYTQHNGYLGRKTFIGADVRLFVPLLYNRQVDENQKYKSDGTTFKDARNLLTYGFNLTLGRAVDRNLAFLIQGSFLNYKVANTDDFITNYSSPIRSTYYQAQSFGIMPIIEISGEDGLLPIGLSHQIGLGFYRHKIVDMPYLIWVNGANGIETLSSESTPFFDYEKQIKSYTFMYKLNLRIPLSRKLLYNFGIRYNANFTEFISGLNSAQDDILFNHARMGQMMRAAQSRNIIAFETGISFML